MILIQRFIIGSGFRSLEKVRVDIGLLERGDIPHLQENGPSEVLPLIQEVNRLLEVARTRLLRSRNALGNLAHALKTPLTLLSQLSERDEMKNAPEINQQIKTQTAILKNLVDRELKKARLAGTPHPGQKLNLRMELVNLLEALKKIYKDKNLNVQFTIPPLQDINLDREDMLELLGNLLDNAFKWAKSKIFIIANINHHLTLFIEDNGPGVPDEKLNQLSLRGTRMDETAEGHGLGLAIAKDIVEQYSGKIEFKKSQKLGGFSVFIKIPLS